MTIIFAIASCSFMYQAAESGKRSGFLWGSITLLWMVALSAILDFGIGTAFFGFFASFVSMTIANFISDPKMK